MKRNEARLSRERLRIKKKKFNTRARKGQDKEVDREERLRDKLAIIHEQTTPQDSPIKMIVEQP